MSAASVVASGRIPAASLLLGRRIARIAGDDSDEAVLAVSLALSALDNGSVLVDLTDPERALPAVEEAQVPLAWPAPAAWVAALAGSQIAGSVDSPLHLSGSRVFLQRYWCAEVRIAANLLSRADGAGVPPGAGAQGGAQPDRDTESTGGTAAAARGESAAVAAVAAVAAATAVAAVDAAVATGDSGAADAAAAAGETGGAAAAGTAEPGGGPHDPAIAGLDDEQRSAVVAALTRRLTILTGGPGTGKTYTIARMLTALHGQNPAAPPTIALAAPTGKAAARMKEAILEHYAAASPAEEGTGRGAGSAVGERPGGGGVPGAGDVRVPAAPGSAAASGAHVPEFDATTLHRLLKPVPGDFGRFRRNRDNPLPHDVVVVDETSMVSVALLDALLEAVRPDARLVLVGDPDQLASVEAGTVLVDIVRSDRLPVKRLQRNHRNKGGVAALAAAIREGNPAANHEGDPAANREEDEERILDLLRSSDDLHWQEAVDKPSAVVDGWIAQWGSDLRRSAAAGDVAESLTTLNGLRVLCAHRRGPAGVATWAPLVIDRFGAGPGRWPLGQPMMITKNGVVPGLYNGDTGVIVRADTGVRVAFSDTIQVAPERLGSETQAAYALTTHKAQGSQFDKVVLVLPEPGSRILTRELLYTAVTRAKSEVAILGSQASLAAALTRRVGRATGLSERLS